MKDSKCRHNFYSSGHYYFCIKCGTRRYMMLLDEKDAVQVKKPGRWRGFMAGMTIGFAVTSIIMIAMFS